MNKNNYYLIFVSISFTFIYAFMRYISFGDTSIQQVPLYILNKVFSFSGVIIISATIAISQVKKRKKLYNKQAKKQNTLLGLTGLFFIILHFLISVILFSKEYFPNFYNLKKLSITGELSLLFANLAIILLFMAGIISFIKVFSKIKFKIKNSYLQLIKIALVFTCIHLLFMGINSWNNYYSWSGNLPPITMLAFIIILIVLSIRLFYGFKNNSSQKVSEEELKK